MSNDSPAIYAGIIIVGGILIAIAAVISKFSDNEVIPTYPTEVRDKKPNLSNQPKQELDAEPKTSNGGLIVIGYICALVSLAIFPIPFGITGFVLGVVNLTKGSTGHGVAQMLLSLICAVVGTLIGFSAGMLH